MEGVSIAGNQVNQIERPLHALSLKMLCGKVCMFTLPLKLIQEAC
jgi:hypothetical protein